MKAKLFTLVLLFLGTAGIAYAQTGAGTIQGTVKDPSGAVVPGAKVTITETQTARNRDTTTNGVGFYVFPSVLIGPYKVTVEAPGMEAYSATLNLQASQTAEVDATMKVGATSTEVVVNANVTPLVNTTDATLSTVVEHARIEQLPQNGRRVDNLILDTTPGVTAYRSYDGSTSGPGASTVPTVNGILYGSEMTQDGALLENRDWQRLPDRLPGLDTIDEFVVETSNASAKNERPGTFIITTRHGTNRLHGSLFETNRDNSVGVARHRQDSEVGFKAPHLVRNEFGGSAGGPLDIPKLYNGRDKTFFFFSYEGYRLRQARTGSATLPTAAMRQGDFSGLVNSAGQYYQLYNPYTTTADATSPYDRQVFGNGILGSPGNNQIPQNFESPLAKYLYSVTPLPTLPNVNPLVADNWFGLGTSNQNQNTSTVRLDHQFSEKDQTFFRFSHGTNVAINYNNGAGGTWPSTTDGFFNIYAPAGHTDDGVLSWTHTYSPTFFGETLFTYGRDYHIEAATKPGTSTLNVANKLGLPNPINSPEPPPIVDTGFGNFDYNSAAFLNIAKAKVMDLDENLTKTIGRHELLLGGTLQYEHDYTLPDQQYSSGYQDFGTLATSLINPSTIGSSYGPLPFTGSNAANFFLGSAWYQAFVNRNAYLDYVSSKDLYFQDNFKVNSRLTLNLGIRWEYNAPAHLADNSLVSFDPKTHAVVLQTSIQNLARLGDVVPQIAADYTALGVQYETPAQAGLPQNLVHSNYHDFGPRLGFAYRLTSGEHYSVLRGGYGRYYYPDSLRLWNGENQFTVPVSGTLLNNPDQGGAQSPDGLPNYTLRTVPTIVAGQNSQNAISLNQAIGISPGSGYVSWLDPNSPTSRADMWNLTYEKEIATGTALSLTYVGTHGADMPQYYSINDGFNAGLSDFAWFMNTGQPHPANPVVSQPFDQTFGQIQEYRKTGWSNDNSFQFEVQHQYSKGYAFQVFYVLSNSFRAAGDGWRSNYVLAPNLFLPGMLPSDYHAADRYLNYQRDTGYRNAASVGVPKHNVKWNWIGDLPFGRGKLVGRNAHGFVNQVIGGWQFAGSGNWYSRYFSPETDLYGQFNGVHVYGNGNKVVDCTSGQCVPGTLWWNGYIPADVVKSNAVQGLPSNYTPFQTPLIPVPANGISSSDPFAPYYGSNSVCVNLGNKTYQVLTPSSPCLANSGAGTPGYELTGAELSMPFPQNIWNPQSSNKHYPGPNEWDMDASLFKEFPISESVRLRFNMDFFNVFNRQGTLMPNTFGIITTRKSDLVPRELQMTLRLSW